MTDELDQEAIGEPGADEPMENVVSPAASADSSIVAGFPTLDDVPSPTDVSRDDVKDAAKWLWRHTFGDNDDGPPEPMTANVEFEAEEEVTMETSNVEHDDPPPPERPADERR
jgi:hypothetical protein